MYLYIYIIIIIIINIFINSSIISIICIYGVFYMNIQKKVILSAPPNHPTCLSNVVFQCQHTCRASWCAIFGQYL